MEAEVLLYLYFGLFGPNQWMSCYAFAFSLWLSLVFDVSTEAMWERSFHLLFRNHVGLLQLFAQTFCSLSDFKSVKMMKRLQVCLSMSKTHLQNCKSILGLKMCSRLS